MQWGIQAASQGVTGVYRELPPACEAERFDTAGQRQIVRREKKTVCNYPPLSVYVLWGLGEVHQALSADCHLNTSLVAIPVRLADRFRRPAAGVWLPLARHRVGERTRGRVGVRGPVSLSPLDGRWCLVGAGRQLAARARRVDGRGNGTRKLAVGRFVVGHSTGSQDAGRALAPVWLLALVIAPARYRVLLGMAAAALTLNVVALPFWLTSGWQWIREGFVSNLLQKYPDTTLKAFNLWYLDLLWTGSRDSTRMLMGLSRDTWGKALLAAGLAGGFAVARLRWRGEARAYLWMTSWVLLVTVMLPTRVHERYLILSLPFLICAAFDSRKLWMGVGLLVVVALFQVTWPNWATRLADEGTAETVRQKYTEVWQAANPERQQQMPRLEEVLADHARRCAEDSPKEYGLTALALFGTGWILIALAHGDGQRAAKSADAKCVSRVATREKARP